MLTPHTSHELKNARHIDRERETQALHLEREVARMQPRDAMSQSRIMRRIVFALRPAR